MANRTTIESAVGALVSMFEANEHRPLGLDTDALQSVLLRPLVGALAEECPIGEHGFAWNPKGWKAGIKGRWSAAANPKPLLDAVDWLDLYLGKRPGGANRIERRDLQALAREDALVQFVAVMAWGYSKRGMGWWQAKSAIERASAGGSIEETATRTLERFRRLSCSGDLTAVANAWLDDGHRAHIPHIRAAFASKFAYAAATPDGRGAPLIADRRVAWAFWMLTGLWDIRTSAELYRRYVETAMRWSIRCGCRAEEIERALFTLGPEVIATWNART